MHRPLLEFDHLTVRRRGREVLHDLSLAIPLGEHVVLMGPNGSGKSTLLKLITRECYPLPHPERRFRVAGEESWNVFDLRHLLGIVSNDWQDTFDRPISGEEAVLSGFFSSVGVWPTAHITDEMRCKAQEVLAFLGVLHLKDRLMTDLSSGEARRLLIGRALVHDPEVLVLDEPTNSLDLRATQDFQNTLRRLAQAGRHILIATHHLHDILPEMDRVILLDQGRMVYDGPKRNALTSQRLSALFKTPLTIEEANGSYFWRPASATPS